MINWTYLCTRIESTRFSQEIPPYLSDPPSPIVPLVKLESKQWQPRERVVLGNLLKNVPHCPMPFSCLKCLSTRRLAQTQTLVNVNSTDLIPGRIYDIGRYSSANNVKMPLQRLFQALAPGAGLEPKAPHNSTPTHHTIPCSHSIQILMFLNPQKICANKIGWGKITEKTQSEMKNSQYVGKTEPWLSIFPPIREIRPYGGEFGHFYPKMQKVPPHNK